ncbi:enhancer of polycomb-like-domain-containing protein [Epithele typhae]|uniref:enhancer of polycomb-like-domain-containing protein n=1 Tax=Epithele typhae TaxID=378194 RepID=UPI002008CA49|nr:enhancer of polycomb-like-domain-containing protein [Epithele typhae]KAH9927133.1 enhancer of polycomb-like-domain-containing protein [Epithele typhae]
MPRATHPGPAALRNRNRVTNKTRLKVIKDTIEADSIVLDEDEEKARVVSTAGVDAEDANEHHLQAVLSAAASRHQALRATRAGEKDPAPAAYIPTPDSTGIVHNYADLHVAGRWKEPHGYVKYSETVEEATSFALANGFIYYMDERDKEWLDKNNEQARGEGSSSASTVSGTRSARSAKAKGKEPDIVQPISISENEFELVMSILEKVTHEKTEFLHHGLQQGAPFPPFSEYQDTFATPLPPDMFACYSAPSWIPAPAQMLRFARLVYPYWRERRIERGGHRIIPAVNLDESDTKNESYICFRRREIKAVRKTRASQTSFSDRMVRLQSELSMALDLVQMVQQRETLKHESESHNSIVWAKRRSLADLKRAQPSLGAKDDEELFWEKDKERPPKKKRLGSKKPGISVKQPPETGSPVPAPTPLIRPKDRQAAIQAAVDHEVSRFKDSKWEDVSDNPYLSPFTPYGCRLFKPIPARPTQSMSTVDEDRLAPAKPRFARLRSARGRGRLMLDRRINATLRAARFDDEEGKDRVQRLQERFRYDDDDGAHLGKVGPDEVDRKFVDERQPSHLLFSMGLLQGDDFNRLQTDPVLRLSSGEHKAYSIGPTPLVMKQPLPQMRQPTTPTVPSISSGGMSQPGPSGTSGTPISQPTVVKKLPQSNGQVLRISNGRVLSGGHAPQSPHTSPPSTATSTTFPDVHITPAKTADPDVQMTDANPTNVPAPPTTPSLPMPSPSPVSAKTVMSTAAVNIHNLQNGYPMSVNGYPIQKNGYIHPNARHNGLSLQQMQSIATMLPDNNVNIALRQPGAYIIPNGAPYPMQMAGGRPVPWPMTGQQSPPNVPNGVAVDGSSVQGQAGSPVRAPSASGMRAPQRAPMVNGNPALVAPANAHIAARLAPHSPSPHMLSPNMAASQVNVHSSPPRAPQSAIPTPSPSMQSRQLVSGSGAAGY